MASPRQILAHLATKGLRREDHSSLFPARALLFFRSPSQRMGFSSYHPRERLQLLLSRGKDRQNVHGPLPLFKHFLRASMSMSSYSERSFLINVSERIQKNIVLSRKCLTFFCPFFLSYSFFFVACHIFVIECVA
jgi:hypothetical protein